MDKDTIESALRGFIDGFSCPENETGSCVKPSNYNRLRLARSKKNEQKDKEHNIKIYQKIVENGGRLFE